MTREEQKEILEELHDRYNNLSFIEKDPISIPHLFERKEDIEISGFLAATIAWGNRTMIVRNANRMVSLMEGEPYRFIMEASKSDMASFDSFVHRTFNGSDFADFVKALQNIYRNNEGMEHIFTHGYNETGDIRGALAYFRDVFFEIEHESRAERHLSSVNKNSACKRINMFLRWMVRSDDRGVDFGLWKNIPMSALYIPLDVHSGNIGRQFDLLTRKQNDWKSVDELTSNLRMFNSNDPVRYDYSLFGVGVNKDL